MSLISIEIKLNLKNKRKMEEYTYSTTLGCLIPFKSDISLIAVLGTPSSSFSSFIFFKATIYSKYKMLFLVFSIFWLEIHLFISKIQIDLFLVNAFLFNLLGKLNYLSRN